MGQTLPTQSHSQANGRVKLTEELRDPWAVLVAAVAGGAAWAVGIPLAAAAGVGAAVLGAKALLGSLMDRERGLGARLLPVRGNSAEERWLKRAERASRSFSGLAGSVRPGPVKLKVETIGERMATTLDAIRRLAGQTSAVGSALRHIDAASLLRERERLSAELKRTRSDDIRTERERSLESVKAQLGIHDRLVQASRTLLARVESATIGLEALVARLAEVLALAETATAPRSLHRIDELADELEGLRSGLVETESLSRQALRAYQEQT